MVQGGPLDTLCVQADPQDPLLPPVVVQRHDGLLGRRGQDVQTSVAQTVQEDVRVHRGQEEGLT